jgi:hypothetical protein
MLPAGATPGVAAEQEIRDFAVKVGGKPAGTYRMTITHQNDGTWQMDGRAVIKVGLLYKYSYEGTEVWKDGQLVYLDSTTNDNGKRFRVLARTENNALRVWINRKDRLTRPDVWTTTYWKLADTKFRNQLVPLLDADTGKDINATLKYLDEQQINVAGQVQKCSHYRLTGGGLQVQLWYDAQERLVREEFIEDGSVIVMERVR